MAEGKMLSGATEGLPGRGFIVEEEVDRCFISSKIARRSLASCSLLLALFDVVFDKVVEEREGEREARPRGTKVAEVFTDDCSI